jgi:nitroreductase
MSGDLDEVLLTTRSVRRRLDYGRPVERDLIRECLELAVHAPNGGNRQDWRFVVVDEPAVLEHIAGYYRKASQAYLAAAQATQAGPACLTAARTLAERLHEVPALVVGCLNGRLPEGAPPATQSSFFGSIYPALWSFMLAARARGLGTTLTTVQLAYEREIAALLGIPYETTTQAAMIAVGYLVRPPAGPAVRRPLDEVMSWNHWNHWHQWNCLADGGES